MQIILLERVHNVGDLGEVVKVRQGYARNFLIPQGKAKRATPENLKLLEEKRGERERAAAERLTQAQERAAKLEGVSVHITQKAGVDGGLFGSVTMTSSTRWRDLAIRSRRRWCAARRSAEASASFR
jgi:large subunit ribosomal protein L9